MSLRQLAYFVLPALAALLTGASGRADAVQRRTAFAVVIGNNRSLEHRRPDLHYADDDAAKYFAILQTMAPERAFLLADFDDDTARLFPSLHPRPHIFSRGPGGRDEQPIVAVAGRSGARTFRLSDAAPMRVRLRDRESVPVLDAHQDGGVALTLALPDEWADGAVVERAGIGGPGMAIQTFAVPLATTDVTLASLQPVAARGAMRGPAEVFHRLFARPFGPRAVVSYLAELKTAPGPVYGVSREDAERMDLLLGQIESAEHGRRMVAGALLFAGAAYFGTLGATAIAFDRSDPGTEKSAADTAGAVSIGIGALFLAGGIYNLARPWSGERLAGDYRGALGKGDYAHAFALANERLEALAAAEARDRWMRGIAGGALVLGSAALIVGNELSNPSVAQRYDMRAIGGFGAVLGVTAIASSLFVETPVEHLTTIWRQDPGRVRIQPTVAPTQGGATFGLVGTF